ncbi:RDD family protein [Devosia sp. YIM 151766]|uniref:RDD family protein n=1 Tax=Devosia sp. YIM 151766 TaxID=3017325 RepID=UPI00255CBE3E|nr:RDD family protein [Devosia sp. YIM 151766]WIY53988.1 RDD family protein [Devosia sp. YIM 151766]
MSQEYAARPYLPDPATAPELFEGLLTRRVTAYVIDVVLIGAITLGLSLVALVLGLFTFGLSLLSLAFVVPAAIVIYYAVTLGSPKRATVGMQAMDIVLTPTRGQPLDGWMAIFHALLFWVSFWISWPVTILFALFTPRRQMLHDLVMGTLMVRRSPMLRHWQRANDYHDGA